MTGSGSREGSRRSDPASAGTPTDAGRVNLVVMPMPPTEPAAVAMDPAGDPLLAAKFRLPAEPRTYVHRQRLVERLAGAAAGPLTVVTGPAGCGKTTLAAAWARSGSPRGPVVWLSLEPTDDDPGVFWTYVLEAFRRHQVPLPVPDEVAAPRSRGVVGQSLLARLVCALERLPEPVTLVLDGVDALRDREVTGSLRFVIDHAPDRLHVVLASRVDPLLPLHRYRIEDRLVEIRGADLAFTTHEAGRLLRRHGMSLARGCVETLTGRTQGWAAGVRLCALAMERSADPEGFVRSFAASQQAVADYLLAEVLDAQPPATRELLLRASILDQVHPRLADALTERSDASAVLAGLAHANAFVEPLGDTPWYRLHPLFADVLRTHLRSRRPSLEATLHRRAAHWLADAGHLGDALGHATAAGDWPDACTQAVRSLMVGRLLTGPDSGRLTALFAGMPDDVPGAEPALVAAACCLARGDPPGCRARLAVAEQRMRRCADAGPGAEAALTHALLRLLCEQPNEAHEETYEETARQAGGLMAQVPWFRLKEHPEIRALLHYGRACALLAHGRLDAAGAAFAEAIGACSAGTGATRPVRHAALTRLALAEAAQGTLTQAERHAARPVEDSVVPQNGAGHLALASVARQRGDDSAADRHLGLAETCGDVRTDPLLTAERAVLRCQAALARGRWEAASAELDAHGPAGSLWTAQRLAVARSTVALARGDPETAISVLRPPDRDDAPMGPPRAAALALAHLAAGDADTAVRLAAPLTDSSAAGLADRIRARLALARAALLRHETAVAHGQLAQAIDAARPEGLRQPFSEAGPWLRRLIDESVWHGSPPTDVVGAAPAFVEPLSGRERQVLRCVAQMMSTDEIAAELHLSVNTVKTHLRSIYRKLCVSRRRDAVERGRDLGLL